MRKNTIPALPVATTATIPVVDTTTIDAVSPCKIDKSAELSIDNSIDNPIIDSIDNTTITPIIDSIDNTTITHIKSNHEIAIIKLSETEALLNDAIAQFESAKYAAHNATTAPQPVVNMDVLDLESEAIRVAAIEAQQALALRTAQLVLIARRSRVHNAVKAVKNAVETVNEEVSVLLQNRMKILEKNLSPMLIGLNEFRHVAAALGWRAGTLSEACESIERDFVLDLPDVALPRRVPLPNVLAAADIALNGTSVPKAIEGQLADGSQFNPTRNGRIHPGDIQSLAEQYRDSLKVDSLIQDVVSRHDGRKFSTANAIRPNYSLGGFINIELPTGGSVNAF